MTAREAYEQIQANLEQINQLLVFNSTLAKDHNLEFAFVPLEPALVEPDERTYSVGSYWDYSGCLFE